MEHYSCEKLYINRIPRSNNFGNHDIVINLLSCRLAIHVSILRASRNPTITYSHIDQHFEGPLGSHNTGTLNKKLIPGRPIEKDYKSQKILLLQSQQPRKINSTIFKSKINFAFQEVQTLLCFDNYVCIPLNVFKIEY